MGGPSFGERFYQTLANDPTYSQLIRKVELPADSQLTKSKVSSTVGYVAAKSIGIGWRSIVYTNIHFGNCPIVLGRFFKDENVYKTVFYSPILSSKNYAGTRCWIYAKTEGSIFNRKLLGMGVSAKLNERNCPGSESIDKDNTLMDDILELTKNKRGFFGNVDLKVKVAGGLQLCEIEWSCLYHDKVSPEEMTKVFSCILRIAEHVQENL